MTLEEICNLPILCVRDCEGDDCPILDTTQKNSQSHSISTSSTVDFFGNTITKYQTSRAWHMSSQIFIDHARCGHLEQTRTATGSISESCTHKHSDIFYLNMQERVCLYRLTEFSVGFSGSPEPEPIAARGYDGGTYLFAKFRTHITTNCQESWILIRNGAETVLKTDDIPTGYNNGLVIFISPTPDQWAQNEWIFFDEEILEHGCYNIYQACSIAGPNSKTALDGTADGAMFFPDWCRECVIDPQWTAAARHVYGACHDFVPVVDNAGDYIEGNLVEVLPVGDFARHPVHGDFYSFILPSDRTHPPGVVNHLDHGVPEDVLTEFVTLKENTVFFPVSLM
jgi:hypothetical protein